METRAHFAGLALQGALSYTYQTDLELDGADAQLGWLISLSDPGTLSKSFKKSFVACIPSRSDVLQSKSMQKASDATCKKGSIFISSSH